MGYYPFLVLGHDTADYIVTQQGWVRARGRDTVEQGRPARRCDTAGLRAGASGSARTRPGHRSVSLYKILYRDRGQRDRLRQGATARACALLHDAQCGRHGLLRRDTIFVSRHGLLRSDTIFVSRQGGCDNARVRTTTWQEARCNTAGGGP